MYLLCYYTFFPFIQLLKTFFFPFLFHYDKNYIPSLKGESNTGISTSVGLFLFITQKSLVNNAKLLINKYIVANSSNNDNKFLY